MNNKFSSYLTEIKFPTRQFGNIDSVLKIIESIFGIVPNDIFISGNKYELSKLEFSSIWIFRSKGEICIIDSNFDSDYWKLSTSMMKIDAIVLKSNVRAWHCESMDFDFSSATTNSYLYITFYVKGVDSSKTLIASGANCDTLLRLFSEHIKPHLVS